MTIFGIWMKLDTFLIHFNEYQFYFFFEEMVWNERYLAQNIYQWVQIHISAVIETQGIGQNDWQWAKIISDANIMSNEYIFISKVTMILMEYNDRVDLD